MAIRFGQRSEQVSRPQSRSLRSTSIARSLPINGGHHAQHQEEDHRSSDLDHRRSLRPVGLFDGLVDPRRVVAGRDGAADPATIDTLKTDSALLTKVLTYRVVPGQIEPSEIVGTHKTVEGGEVTVTGSGDNWKVNDATVLCGGVQTANATVYLIDSVLMPSN